MPMREYPPIYSIVIEEMTTKKAVATIRQGPIGPLIAGLLEAEPAMKAQVEATDSRTYRRNRKPRGIDPLPLRYEYGGL